MKDGGASLAPKPKPLDDIAEALKKTDQKLAAKGSSAQGCVGRKTGKPRCRRSQIIGDEERNDSRGSKIENCQSQGRSRFDQQSLAGAKSALRILKR